jgi:hypothetical protein
MRGKTWWIDGCFFETKKMPTFSTIFSVFSTEWRSRPLLGGFFWLVN